MKYSCSPFLVFVVYVLSTLSPPSMSGRFLKEISLQALTLLTPELLPLSGILLHNSFDRQVSTTRLRLDCGNTVWRLVLIDQAGRFQSPIRSLS